MAAYTAVYTQKQYDEAVKKLDYLTNVKAKEIIEQVNEAKSHGDLSENAEYAAAREAQDNNNSEIGRLTALLDNVKIINAPKGDKIGIGSQVTFSHILNGEEELYSDCLLVDTSLADPINNLLSADSPVGYMLIDKKAGEKFSVQTPGGLADIVIVKVVNEDTED